MKHEEEELIPLIDINILFGFIYFTCSSYYIICLFVYLFIFYLLLAGFWVGSKYSLLHAYIYSYTYTYYIYSFVSILYRYCKMSISDLNDVIHINTYTWTELKPTIFHVN